MDRAQCAAAFCSPRPGRAVTGLSRSEVSFSPRSDGSGEFTQSI